MYCWSRRYKNKVLKLGALNFYNYKLSVKITRHMARQLNFTDGEHIGNDLQLTTTLQITPWLFSIMKCICATLFPFEMVITAAKGQ